MRKLLHLIWIVAALSCDEHVDSVDLDNGYDYYPLEIGAFRDYEVLEINYSPEADSSVFYLREQIADTIVSAGGDVRYVLYRYKSDDLMNWEVDSVWSALLLNNALVVYENNIAFIKLTFPVKDGATWNGNAYNTMSQMAYYFERPGEWSLADTTFASDHVIQLVINDIPENTTGMDMRSEIYIQGVGLAEKNYETYKYCTASSCGEIGGLLSGRVLKQKLIVYGKE